MKELLQQEIREAIKQRDLARKEFEQVDEDHFELVNLRLTQCELRLALLYKDLREVTRAYEQASDTQ